MLAVCLTDTVALTTQECIPLLANVGDTDSKDLLGEKVVTHHPN